jgi:hypothetical protein
MNGNEELNPVAKWTVMVYIAADNDLEEKAIADLKEMKKVGSTDEVNIVAQLDSRGRGSTYRFRIGDDQTTLDEDVVGDPLPEINTGDPRELTDFIVWGTKKYRAENYMLVLWGHGRGWEDLDNSDRAAAPTTDAVLIKKGPAEQGENGYEERLNGDQSIAITRQKVIRTFLKNRTEKQKTRETLESQIARDDIGKADFRGRFQFRKGLAPQGNGNYSNDGFDQTLSKRTESESLIGFLTDQTPGKESEISQDVLKLSELEVALAEAIKCPDALNGRKIDILGMDACLMGMAEVGYQIREQVKYLVASEDAIPDEGWPYERILYRLVKNPYMPPEDLAVTIVREFLIYYREQNKDVTKSVCNLSRSDDLADAIRKLARQLITKISINLGPVGAAILASRAMSQTFYLKDYVDLYDFCSHLGPLCGDNGIKKRCSKLMNVIRRNEVNADNGQSAQQPKSTEEPFVHSYGFIGHRLRDANGVSIYFPCFHPSPKYAELQFAEKSKWGEFISALSGLFSEKSSFSEARPDTAGVPLVAVGGRVKADLGTREKIDQGMQQKLPHPPPRKGPKHPTITPAETVNEEIGTRSRKQEVAKK